MRIDFNQISASIRPALSAAVKNLLTYRAAKIAGAIFAAALVPFLVGYYEVWRKKSVTNLFPAAIPASAADVYGCGLKQIFRTHSAASLETLSPRAAVSIPFKHLSTYQLSILASREEVVKAMSTEQILGLLSDRRFSVAALSMTAAQIYLLHKTSLLPLSHLTDNQQSELIQECIKNNWANGADRVLETASPGAIRLIPLDRLPEPQLHTLIDKAASVQAMTDAQIIYLSQALDVDLERLTPLLTPDQRRRFVEEWIKNGYRRFHGLSVATQKLYFQSLLTDSQRTGLMNLLSPSQQLAYIISEPQSARWKLLSSFDLAGVVSLLSIASREQVKTILSVSNNHLIYDLVNGGSPAVLRNLDQIFPLCDKRIFVRLLPRLTEMGMSLNLSHLSPRQRSQLIDYWAQNGFPNCAVPIFSTLAPSMVREIPLERLPPQLLNSLVERDECVRCMSEEQIAWISTNHPANISCIALICNESTFKLLIPRIEESEQKALIISRLPNRKVELYLNAFTKSVDIIALFLCLNRDQIRSLSPSLLTKVLGAATSYVALCYFKLHESIHRNAPTEELLELQSKITVLKEQIGKIPERSLGRSVHDIGLTPHLFLMLCPWQLRSFNFQFITFMKGRIIKKQDGKHGYKIEKLEDIPGTTSWLLTFENDNTSHNDLTGVSSRQLFIQQLKGIEISQFLNRIAGAPVDLPLITLVKKVLDSDIFDQIFPDLAEHSKSKEELDWDTAYASRSITKVAPSSYDATYVRKTKELRARMQLPEQSCFNILGFDRMPTIDDLNSAYRKFVLLLHPDKNGGKPHATEAEILFKWVNQANELTKLLIERRR